MAAITIDETLDLLSFAGAELVNGNSNHGPMAAEALFALGRDDAVLPWVEAYRRRLIYRPQPSLAIPPDEWREHLGASERIGDWITLFENELAEAPWRAVVRQWVPRLAPGLMAAATHGLIRTAHAVRSLSRAETPQRKYELAQGLGYWAARYYQLPGSPTPVGSSDSPRDALSRVQRLHDSSFDLSGSIAQQVKGIEAHPEFAPVIDLAGPQGDVSRFLSELTETFALIYLASNKNLIAFVHTVTAPSALRLLLPCLKEQDARLATRYAWQACAAVYAWYATAPAQDRPEPSVPAETHDQLIDRAVAAGGAHSIKFTEACLREYAINPSPVYLAAARDAAQRVGPI